MDSAVETRGLTVRFGGVTAIAEVDFLLRRGELRCLIGPNGAGKSTFFKCLTGQLAPSEGQVLIGGEDVTGWLPHEIARLGVGIKTQVPNVFDALSVRENIWLAAYRLKGRAGASGAAEAAIARLRLEAIAARAVGQLAHGERQRVELGIVIAGDPWLILLDEPAAGLTGAEVEDMAALIGTLGERATLVVVEHDMQFIRSIARRVTVFNRGRVFADAEVGAVMADPRVRDIYLGKRA